MEKYSIFCATKKFRVQKTENTAWNFGLCWTWMWKIDNVIQLYTRIDMKLVKA